VKRLWRDLISFPSDTMMILATLLFFAVLFLLVTVSCENRQEQVPEDAKSLHHDVSNDEIHAVPKKKVKTGGLYRVIKAHEGGWKKSDVAAPFKTGAQVFCHKDMTLCSSGEGVDFLSNEKTVLCEVEVADTTLIRVKCEDREKSQLMSDECCETATTEDTSVYATPRGLIHYATWGNTEPITIATGMKIVEDSYESSAEKSLWERTSSFLVLC